MVEMVVVATSDDNDDDDDIDDDDEADMEEMVEDVDDDVDDDETELSTPRLFTLGSDVSLDVDTAVCLAAAARSRKEGPFLL